jgi:hypothetical protein
MPRNVVRACPLFILTNEAFLQTGHGDSWSAVEAPVPAGGVSVNGNYEVDSVAS